MTSGPLPWVALGLALSAGLLAVAGTRAPAPRVPDGEALRVRDLDRADRETVAAAGATVRLRDASPGTDRETIARALQAGPGAPAVIGDGPWRTRIVLGRRRDLGAARARRRVFAVLDEGTSTTASELALDVRLGAGRRGAFMPGIVDTSAVRAVVEVRLADPGIPGATFRVVPYADDGPGGRTLRAGGPRWLSRDLPPGTVRFPVGVPSQGARFVVAVWSLGPGSVVAARAWSSVIEVRRPWR